VIHGAEKKREVEQAHGPVQVETVLNDQPYAKDDGGALVSHTPDKRPVLRARAGYGKNK
jgi:hypothetical protein